MDLSQLMHAAADAAKRQQDESKTQMLEVVASMEKEMDRIQKEHEITLQNTIRQVENEAAEELERIKRDVYESMQAFEEDTLKSAELEIERQCAERRQSLEEQYQSLLADQLESQRDKLSAEFERILLEKDDEIKQKESNLQRQLESLEHEHQMEVEALNNEIWNKAQQKVAIESERVISRVVSDAEEQCQAFQQELDWMRNQLQEKDAQLKSSNDNMAELDHVAREINARHHSEMAHLSEEKLALVRENEQFQKALHMAECNNASLKEELAQVRSSHRTIELRSLEQEDLIRAFDQRKTETVHRFADSCKQLLEQQILDLKAENASLTKALEQKTVTIFELTTENKEHSSKVTRLSSRVAFQDEKISELENQCVELKRKYTDANECVNTLQQEKLSNTREIKQRLKQKEMQLEQLTEALDAIGKKSSAKVEPVVVHLHGNNGEDSQRRSAHATSECHHLRSRLLELQRSNYRLESDLMEAKQKCQAREKLQSASAAVSPDVQQLQQENNSLKQIVTMMRKEMENVTNVSGDSENEESPPGSYILSLEQQLVQCRAYLDILLKAKVIDETGKDDEVHFLRSRYRELHEVLDRVREDYLRYGLQQGYNDHSDPKVEFDHKASATVREQELIQKLEEASDEIEALLNERDELLTLSNQLKNEVKLLKQGGHCESHPIASQSDVYAPSKKVSTIDNDKNLMSALLNDLSRSCDDESDVTSSEANRGVFACFGNKPPLSNSSEYRPSKNGYGGDLRPKTASARTTSSQRQSLNKITNKQRKATTNESRPQRVRNWNSKQD